MAGTYATTADVIVLAPELAAFAGPQLSLIVDTITQELIDLSAWGNLAHEGHRTLAAHYATVILNSSAATGAITSRRIGQIGETYQTAATVDELAKTKYGQMHIALRATLVSTSSHGDTDRGWTLAGGRIL